MNMDPQAQCDALNNFIKNANAYKAIELKTWTFAADQRQMFGRCWVIFLSLAWLSSKSAAQNSRGLLVGDD